MTKLLIVNQPLNNRGDEAAHKALIRTLLREIANVEIRVLFVDCYSPDGMRQFTIKSPKVKYINITSFWWHSQIGPGALKNGLYFLWKFHPTTHDIKKQYKWADYVICAPGGICMGGFQDWNHLYFLQWAKFCHKPLIYFARSLGPFPTETSDNILFKKKSIEMLKYFSFLSIRDQKSEQILDNLNLKISYHSTTDTAFLETPNVDLPYELKLLIKGKKYIIFVPNLLLWHYAYKNKGSKEQLIDFYANIIKNTLEIHSNYSILMLPQTFDNTNEDENDINFFREIANKVNDHRVMITADCYSSDIQQTLIKGAYFLIGARYHSIVFAINQGIPFIALNYEHKMEGLLNKLNINNCGISLKNIFKNADSILDEFKTKISNINKLHYINYALAKDISISNFRTMQKKFNL
ncbi:polysaccharide pyruvyl transferase family protein [Fibrobacter sp. UBA4297]|uniref:polysaccharide pyruvyl transferase family protein n=1 Tax=Fibrobacter sp. UBA4297 TaxID=1946536 RepID=UPI0025B900EA|nr:polysaccharide pyruvyl transferase family protein [Fibrobacter sp. UBA4297]